jgi:hypothetical protein
VSKKVGAHDNRAPKEDLVVKLFDFRFELDGSLNPGTQVIRIETPGPSMHEVDIYRLHQGRTVADLNAWRKQQGHGAAPAQALGGALDSHDIHRVVWLRKYFPPRAVRAALRDACRKHRAHTCRCRNGAGDRDQRLIGLGYRVIGYPFSGKQFATGTGWCRFRT